MKYYYPNQQEGTHTIRVTLQWLGYSGHIEREIRGNCKGLAVLDFDFECETEFGGNDCQLAYNEDYDLFSALLRDEDGNTLRVECDAEEMNRMIVALEIVGFVKGGN